METREITITLNSPEFKTIMMEAFEEAARRTIERMGQLAVGDEERAIVERLGRDALAELEGE